MLFQHIDCVTDNYCVRTIPLKSIFRILLQTIERYLSETMLALEFPQPYRSET